MCLLRYNRTMVSRQGLLSFRPKNGGKSISYPEFSGSLDSGWLPRETLRESQKFNFFDWLPRNGSASHLHCFTQEGEVPGGGGGRIPYKTDGEARRLA